MLPDATLCNIIRKHECCWWSKWYLKYKMLWKLHNFLWSVWLQSLLPNFHHSIHDLKKMNNNNMRSNFTKTKIKFLVYYGQINSSNFLLQLIIENLPFSKQFLFQHKPNNDKLFVFQRRLRRFYEKLFAMDIIIIFF